MHYIVWTEFGKPIFTPYIKAEQGDAIRWKHIAWNEVYFDLPYFVTQPFFLISSQNSRTRSLRQNIFSIIVKLYEEAVTEKTPQTRVEILADHSTTVLLLVRNLNSDSYPSLVTLELVLVVVQKKRDSSWLTNSSHLTGLTRQDTGLSRNTHI